jgi:uncharacterized membrane protein HdeD (DUF308 family)
VSARKEKIREAAIQAQESISDRLRHIWWSFLIRGLFAVALAICALFWPERTILILTRLLGIYFLVDGITGLVVALRNNDKGHALLPAIASFAAGLVLIFWTAISARVFLIIIGIWAVLQGAGLLYSSWQMEKDDENRWLVAAIGLIIAVVGVVFIAWPETGAVAVSWLIAIGALVVGGLLIFLATRLKGIRKRVDAVGKGGLKENQ